MPQAPGHERFKEAVIDTLKDDEIGRLIWGVWAKHSDALDEGDQDAIKALDAFWTKHLLPKVEARVGEIQTEFDRKLAENAYAPPDAKGLAKFADENWRPSPVWLAKTAHDDEDIQIQRFCDDIYMLNAITAHEDANIQRTMREPLLRMYLDSIEAPDHIRALVTPTSGSGSEWVPTILSADYYTLITDKLVIAPIFPTLPMMPGKNVNVPTLSGNADVYFTDGTTTTEAVAVNEDASLASGIVNFVARTLRTRRRWSDELDADSTPAVLVMLRQKLPAGIARSIDMAILNGDTAGTHHDSDVTANNDPRKAWIGLREKCLTDTGANASLATFNLNVLVTIPAAMKPYADPADCAWIWGHKAFWTQLPVLADSGGNPVFLPGTFGTQASPVVRGFAGILLMGVPIYMSSLLRENLNASGAYDGVTTTKQWLCYVNREAWRRAVRKDVTIEVARGSSGAEGGYTSIVAAWRGDFRHMESTNLTTAMGYNF